MGDTPKKSHGEHGVNLAAWDHRPDDPERYGCRNFTTKEDVRLSKVNQPSSYERLSSEDKATLQEWIEREFAPSNEVEPHGSYVLKHILQRLEGLYVTNGEFKGAMLIAGYEPVDRTELNWQFRSRLADPELLNKSLGRAGPEVA